jgi:hypothetical protein
VWEIDQGEYQQDDQGHEEGRYQPDRAPPPLFEKQRAFPPATFQLLEFVFGHVAARGGKWGLKEVKRRPASVVSAALP